MYSDVMTVLAKPLCVLIGHRRAHRRVWNDGVDLRASCVRCGASLIRTADAGWRAFGPDDASPERISRDAYRAQLKREHDLSGASADRPEHWAAQLIAAFADPARTIDPATLFDRLLDDLALDPAFAAAVATGRLDAGARQSVGTAAARRLGAERPLPSQFLDPLARHLHARAQDRLPDRIADSTAS